MSDPFESITNLCKCSDSQEARLLNCHFCAGSQEPLSPFSGEDSSVSDEIPGPPTGIITRSPPVDLVDLEEEFQSSEIHLQMISKGNENVCSTSVRSNAAETNSQVVPPVIRAKPIVKEVVQSNPNEKNIGINTGRARGKGAPSNEDGNSKSNDRVEIEKFKYIPSNDDASQAGPSKVPERHRKLSNWVQGTVDNAGVGRKRVGEEVSLVQARKRAREREDLGAQGSRAATTSQNPTQPVARLQDSTDRLYRENDQNERDEVETFDVVEAARKAGMKFPRPRWWRPEGY